MESSKNVTFEDLTKRLDKYLDKNPKLRKSDRRKYILQVIYESGKHLTPDEIYKEVRDKDDEKIGISTVYRTLSFFEDAGLVNVISIGQDTKRYEINSNTHHDHMACLRCGKIIEFRDDDIEALQKEIAKKHDFKLLDHDLTLYGICDKCKEKEAEHSS